MNTRSCKLNVLACSIMIALAAGCASETPDPAENHFVDDTAHTPVLIEHGSNPAHIPADRDSEANEPQPGDRPALSGREKVEADQSVIPASKPVLTERQEEFRSHEMKRMIAGAAKIMYAPAVQLDQIRVPREPLYREQYEHADDQQTLRVADVPVSTFSIDVDTGAYSNMRRWISQGQLPPEDAVRVEEFINYFNYDYPVPEQSGRPFQVQTEIAQTPWNPASHLLRIGVQGYEVPPQALPASNLVFLVDVSGSMQSQDKLPLLKQALSLLTRKMDANDTISLVVYAGASGIVLDSVSGNQNATISNALQQLEAGGSTNGAAGIRLAYQLARQNFKAGGVNRVILATDGDFNVGVASTEELIDMIERQRKSGIALTTLGFGTGNYNDHMLEQLADAGNGNHAYIDRLSEARKVLSEEMSSTLMTIARDVKIQVEFNPQTVAEYRLIGYENRVLNEEDFNNDQVDAGEIGAGHNVTALYEITLAGSDYRRLPPHRYEQALSTNERPTRHADELAHLRIRYKTPREDRSSLIESPIRISEINSEAATASDDFRFAAAVAAFGQKLRGGEYLGSYGYADIHQLASGSRGPDHFGYRGEFLQLVGLAQSLDEAESGADEQLALESR
jgi:Ca-activated chloride channel family protein